MGRTNFNSRRGRRRTGRDAGSSEGHDRWLISYADLVTLLFALFVVLFAAADHERARAISSSLAAEFGEAESAATPNQGNGVLPGVARLDQEEAAINRAFADNPTLSSRARVMRTDHGLVISLAEAGFFAPGGAALREDALALIDSLAAALRQSDAPLRIEGHTDSLPISNSRYPSNWELSTARASNVLAQLTARDIPSSRLSVAGYADERPIADNSTPEGRALNRRVDIVVLSKN